METKKRKYVKPAFEVIELQRHVPLICTSGGGDVDPLNPFLPGDDPLP